MWCPCCYTVWNMRFKKSSSYWLYGFSEKKLVLTPQLYTPIHNVISMLFLCPHENQLNCLIALTRKHKRLYYYRMWSVLWSTTCICVSSYNCIVLMSFSCVCMFCQGSKWTVYNQFTLYLYNVLLMSSTCM